MCYFLGHFFNFIFQPSDFHHISIFNYIFSFTYFPSSMREVFPSLCNLCLPSYFFSLVACLDTCFHFDAFLPRLRILAICSRLRMGQYQGHVKVATRAQRDGFVNSGVIKGHFLGNFGVWIFRPFPLDWLDSEGPQSRDPLLYHLQRINPGGKGCRSGYNSFLNSLTTSSPFLVLTLSLLLPISRGS